MEAEVKKEHKYLPVLVTVIVMLFVTTAAVVSVWYYKEQVIKEVARLDQQQITVLKNQVNDLTKKDSTEQPRTLADKGEYPPSSELVIIRNTCTHNNNSVYSEINNYIKNSDGEFASCSVKEPVGAGWLAFVKKTNGSWLLLYEGNGMAEKKVCTDNKVPNDMNFCTTE